MSNTETGQFPVTKSDDEWRRELSPEEYHVLREAGTERPYTGEYWDSHAEGTYSCRACGAELFTSKEKFDSHCGWPSFWAPLAEGTVRYLRDGTLGMERIEVRCANCNSHLGHVFEGEGYETPTDQRYCINSVSLTLKGAEEPQGAE
jgi:peptide-methionine (R)-S-oxide reductase